MNLPKWTLLGDLEYAYPKTVINQTLLLIYEEFKYVYLSNNDLVRLQDAFQETFY